VTPPPARWPAPPRACAALLLGLAACGSTEPVTGTVRVLFIGNSLTYVNDMPNMLVLLGQASSEVTLEVTDVSNPDYALEDHWNLPQTMDALNAGGWDVVILQQGPSSTPENQANLLEWATRFAERIRSRGGRPALYMVWPDVTRLAFFDDVRESYRSAAEAADADLYPVGEAWRAAWREDPSLPLYDDDGYHPSLMGSYLAALTIYHGLTRRTVMGLPAPSGIPAEVVPLLQRAAEEATAQFGRP
jgi:hypothetical protein